MKRLREPEHFGWTRATGAVLLEGCGGDDEATLISF
jgi:hypothetical protein